ncbi:LytTR family DNA-binding domain-containing protein [Tellurirhabdus bombi]|uniref:LytTR family DNA-binding domain-containing protein n=1 Tax=Tellurirhabdus bombi TaxID=2907205 RepID=UPI001F181552|nr:LytTR family DNA-binding domain-containing protein [Tellurirhabdus bombi]
MGRIEGVLLVPEALTHLIGASNYTWVYFWNNEKRIVARNLGAFEKSLPLFIRTHKTVLVNPAYIVKVCPPGGSKKPGSIILKNGTELPVSRRRWAVLAEQFSNLANSADSSLVI